MLEVALIGVFVSSLFVEFTGFYPGGIVVPAYVALYMNQPFRVFGTILVALLCVLFYKLISRFVILFGRRRFVMMILLSGILVLIWRRFLPQYIPHGFDFATVGWIIPGLLANNMERQGFILTILAMIGVSATVYFVGRVLMLL